MHHAHIFTVSLHPFKYYPGTERLICYDLITNAIYAHLSWIFLHAAKLDLTGTGKHFVWQSWR